MLPRVRNPVSTAENMFEVPFDLTSVLFRWKRVVESARFERDRI